MVLVGDKLEGEALKIYLAHKLEVMKEYARISNADFRSVWDIPEPSMHANMSWFDIKPGPHALAEIVDVLPEDFGVATTTAAVEQGFLYTNLAAGENAKALSYTVPNGKVISLYGWVDTAGTTTLEPALTIVKAWKSSRRLRQWPARQGQSQLTDTTIVEDPVIWVQADNIYIDLWMATARNERITWLGLKAQSMG